MSNTIDEDFMPVSSEFLGVAETTEQKQERVADKANVTNALPVIKEILDRFDERIAFYGSVDSIPKDSLVIPEKFMHTVAANKLTKANLEAEKEYLESLLEDL